MEDKLYVWENCDKCVKTWLLIRPLVKPELEKEVLWPDYQVHHESFVAVIPTSFKNGPAGQHWSLSCSCPILKVLRPSLMAVPPGISVFFSWLSQGSRLLTFSCTVNAFPDSWDMILSWFLHPLPASSSLPHNLWFVLIAKPPSAVHRVLAPYGIPLSNFLNLQHYQPPRGRILSEN